MAKKKTKAEEQSDLLQSLSTDTEKDCDTFKIEDLDPISYLPSGQKALDLRLLNSTRDPSSPMGVGLGRMIEIYGPNKSGKSELAQEFMRQFLRKFPQGQVRYFDQEWSADERKLRINDDQRKRFTILRASNLESFYAQCFKDFATIYKLQESMYGKKALSDRNLRAQLGDDNIAPMLIVLDSLAALRTKEETDRDMGKHVIAGAARVNSEWLSLFRKWLAVTDSILVFVNQTRKAPGSMILQDESPGGESVKFYSDYRITVKQIGQYWITSGKQPPKTSGKKKSPPDGFITKLKMIKNKLAPPMRELELAILYEPHKGFPSGISPMWSDFISLHSVGKMKAAGGKFTLDGIDESFSRGDWPDIWTNDDNRKVIHKLIEDLNVTVIE